MAASSGTITDLLVRWGRGEQAVLEALTPLVYQELRRLASRHLRRERPGHTLESTALVHEAYLRLIDQRSVQWQNRNQFFGLASELIRRILVDYARNRMAAKRGGQNVRLSLDEAMPAPEDMDLDLVALDDALEALGISPATVKRDWTLAKAFLKRELTRHAV